MTNFDNITNVLIYKQLHPPQYRTHQFISYLGTVLSKAMFLRFDVHGIGRISQYIIYDIQNKIVKYTYYYYSEEQRKKDSKKNKKRRLAKLLLQQNNSSKKYII